MARSGEHEMTDHDIEVRLTRIETQLEGVLKAQLLLGAVVESGQTDLRRQILETLPQDIAARLGEELSAQVQALSDQIASTIGETLADKRHAAMEEATVLHRPLSTVLTALDALEGLRGPSVLRS